MNKAKLSSETNQFYDMVCDNQFPLILREVAAIGIRISHASQGVFGPPAKGSVTRQ